MFQHELKKHGIPELPASVYMAAGMSAKNVSDAVDSLMTHYTLKDKKEVEVIVTTSDIIAAQIIEILNSRGISVPKDVAVTGFNNWYEGITARSPLTTIDLSYFKRGYAAVELLIDRIMNPALPVETHYFPTNLVVRQSCGCFESSIESEETDSRRFSLPENFQEESEDELRRLILERLDIILDFTDAQKRLEFLDAFFDDLYNKTKNKKTLLWFQNIIQNLRMEKDLDSEMLQRRISQLRTMFFPLIKNESAETVCKIETIFHQMRSLVSVFQKYNSLAERENPYRVNNISEQALSFVSAKDTGGIFSILKEQLAKSGISGAVVCLADDMSKSFPFTKIKFIYPPKSETQTEEYSSLIEEPHLFPKNVFPQEKRYSVVLEILNHADYYMGYAFFEMKDLNIATYDVMKMLLSSALYQVYQSGGKPAENTPELTESPIEAASGRSESENAVYQRERVNAKKITDYLLSHIKEMTDIEKMAEHFMVSKSYLSKKTKELTGLTVQQLHEKLKIEQAKNMLLIGKFPLSEISESLGFKEQTYFSNVFKKNTGLSPKNWLNENK